jgi:hypothetical protein
VLDNTSFILGFSPPSGLYYRNSPFEYKGVIYSPKYNKQGQISYYVGYMENLRLCIYLNNMISLQNSLHKYWHGDNYGDYYLSELRDTITAINEQTGINWSEARVLKLEFGCNITANAPKVINSLLSFKGRDYLQMHRKGSVYGKSCELTDYKIKAYNKTFEVRHTSLTNLRTTIFRWEIAWKRLRNIESWLHHKPLKVKHLLKPETLHFFAKDSVEKYQSSIRKQVPNLFNLSTGEKKAVAAMLVPEIREDLKIHNRETYKKDKNTYQRIMSNESICSSDNTERELQQKFEELIYK